MFVHSVVIWLKKGISEEDKKYVEAESKKLINLPSVVHGWVGTPAATEDTPIDKSYDLLLTFINKDIEGQKAYQASPEHDAYVENCVKFFEKVVVYDAD